MVGKCQNEALRRALFFGMVMSGSCAGAKKPDITIRRFCRRSALYQGRENSGSNRRDIENDLENDALRKSHKNFSC
jgi:hypothetical protein